MTAPVDALGLTALVFALGVKHGFDPDHLVAIDGLARSSARTRPRLARWAGLYFSLGHGAIVTLVALAVALYAQGWDAPGWLEPLGATISVAVLAFLGTLNLLMAWQAAPGAMVAPVALRGRWVSERLAGASHPVMIAAVGAAFALSFDTVSHALLFSLSGASAAGWAFALGLGLVFTLGMALTDALNGWWVARMVRRADAAAAAASRWMSIVIGALCLAIAAGSLLRLTSAYASLIGVMTFLVVLGAYRRTVPR
ncbi:MAG TPA: nickel transporter [Burkholderiales bacterium]|nr:nickel transporter [Burkholderiales bacterium]